MNLVHRLLLAAFVVLGLAGSSVAQTIGGNASLSVTTSTSRVALPAVVGNYPAVLIQPVVGTTVEVFFKLGDVTVTATTSSPTLPSGGVCLNVGPATYVAAITGASTATVRITQLTQCPPFQSAKNNHGITPTCSNKLDFSQACNSQYLSSVL